MVGTAMAPEACAHACTRVHTHARAHAHTQGVRDEIWGLSVADPHSIALALMHRTYSRLLAKTTTLRAVMAE